jgi:outer membrane lipoprotein-sorting protein
MFRTLRIVTVFLGSLLAGFGFQDLVAQEKALPTVTELQMAYLVENGGRANIEAFHSLMASGYITNAEGDQIEFKLYKKRPNLMRMQTDFGSVTVDTVFDGKRGFNEITAQNAEKTLIDLSPEENAQLSVDSLIDGLFYQMRTRPEWLEVVAEADVNGRPAYVIDIAPEANLQIERLWLDQEHFQETKLRRRVISETGETRIEDVYFSDFKRVRGVWTANTMRYYSGDTLLQTVRIERMRANVGIFDSLFQKPEAE